MKKVYGKKSNSHSTLNSGLYSDDEAVKAYFDDEKLFKDQLVSKSPNKKKKNWKDSLLGLFQDPDGSDRSEKDFLKDQLNKGN